MPHLQNNLLAVRDVVESQGPVAFDAADAYIVPLSLIKLLNLNRKIVTCKKGVYISKGTAEAVAEYSYLTYSNTKRPKYVPEHNSL